MSRLVFKQRLVDVWEADHVESMSDGKLMRVTVRIYEVKQGWAANIVAKRNGQTARTFFVIRDTKFQAMSAAEKWADEKITNENDAILAKRTSQSERRMMFQ